MLTKNESFKELKFLLSTVRNFQSHSRTFPRPSKVLVELESERLRKPLLTGNELLPIVCPQNGYPSRRRSLVDDARFETLCVKQTKQSVLEDARHRANG